MEPEQNIAIPEVAPTLETCNVPVGIESSPIAEVVSVSPIQPDSHSEPSEESRTTDPGPSVTTQDESALAVDEVKDLTDSNIEVADKGWIEKVQQVIRDDSGQPYKEEEDAESLNEAYMKSRFNVDVDAPVEEK